MAQQSTQTACVRSMGHYALHYRRDEEGPLAARLLTLMGFTETQDMLLPNGTHFYRFVIDAKHHSRGDGIIYLSAVPEAQRKLLDTVHEALRIGAADEHPAVGEMRTQVANDPEYGFHVGTLLDSLEELETMMQGLEEANRSHPELKGRLSLTYNRALRGSDEVDARLDASPIYGGCERYCYGRNGVQAFVETDILSSGTLGESMVLEFDYVFPNVDRHILSVVEHA
ncbi:MAG: hypothetical protein QM681_04030 [Novosphingobium sp.]